MLDRREFLTSTAASLAAIADAHARPIGAKGVALMQGGGAFSPLSLAPAAWWDPSDLSTLFQDDAATIPITADGQTAGCALDKSGNGCHLIQATASKRPVYRESGGMRWLDFDGVDDLYSITGTLSVSVSPTTVYLAMREMAASGGAALNLKNGGRLWFVHAPHGSFRNGYFDIQNDTSGRVLGPWPLAVGADAMSEFSRVGTTQQIVVNGGVIATGSVSTTDVVLNPTLGAAPPTHGSVAIRFYGGAIINDAPDARMRTWLGKKAGLSL